MINELGNDSDNEMDSDEELMQELINIEADLRGKIRKAVCVESYVESTIPRFSAKQFNQHFRIGPAVFDTLENKLGNLLLRQK